VHLAGVLRSAGISMLTPYLQVAKKVDPTSEMLPDKRINRPSYVHDPLQSNKSENEYHSVVVMAGFDCSG
jgi:hypothetical protein